MPYNTDTVMYGVRVQSFSRHLLMKMANIIDELVFKFYF